MEMTERLDHIEELLADICRKQDALQELLATQRQTKESYTTAEVAEFLHKSDYTVREWCRHGRLRATKRSCGRGKHSEWTIAHDELQRYRNDGLLPLAK